MALQRSMRPLASFRTVFLEALLTAVLRGQSVRARMYSILVAPLSVLVDLQANGKKCAGAGQIRSITSKAIPITKEEFALSGAGLAASIPAERRIHLRLPWATCSISRAGFV
jgi:hypothetical protein